MSIKKYIYNKIRCLRKFLASDLVFSMNEFFCVDKQLVLAKFISFFCQISFAVKKKLPFRAVFFLYFFLLIYGIIIFFTEFQLRCIQYTART
jgi:hypothetical protein